MARSDTGHRRTIEHAEQTNIMKLDVEKAYNKIPVTMRQRLQTGVRLARWALAPIWLSIELIGARSGILASAYYFCFSSAFRREHQAVLRGKIAFRFADSRRQLTSARLRRNTHRLEKGLIMRPRRALFAENYIEQMVSDYRRACEGNMLHESECIWARDVLYAYFAEVGNSPRIDCARREFESITPDVIKPVFVPFSSVDRSNADVSFEELRALFMKRRSTRWYDGRPVPRALIEKAVEIAALAPSACNRQPFYFVVVDEPGHAAAVARLAGGADGFADNVPCMIVSIGDLSCYPEERDRHLIYIDTSLANMQLLLALQTLGLSTCAINWPDIAGRDRILSHELGLLGHERAVMLIAVGYASPDGGIPCSRKKPCELLVRYRSGAERP